MAIASCLVLFVIPCVNALVQPLDDDRLYLYTLKYLMTAPDQYRLLTGQWIEQLLTLGYDPESPARLAFRYEFAKNYFAQAAAFAFVEPALGEFSAGAAMLKIRWTLAAGLALLVAAAVALTGRTLWQSSRPAVTAAAGFIIISAAIWYAELLPSVGWRLTPDGSLRDWLTYPIRAAIFFLQPGHDWEFIGTTPRSVATMLLIPLTLLRWQGRHVAGYWLIPIIVILHSVYGALALFILLGVDLLVRPNALKRKALPIVFAFTMLWVGVFGVKFASFGGAALAWGLVIAGSLLIGLATSAPIQHLCERAAAVRWLRSIDGDTADLVVLAAFIVAILAFSAALSLVSAGLSTRYIVEELSGRPIGLIRVPLLMGAAYALTRRYRNTPIVSASLTGTAALILTLQVSQAFHARPVESAEAVLRALPRSPLQARRPATEAEERAIYIDMIDKIEPELLRTRP